MLRQFACRTIWTATDASACSQQKWTVNYLKNLCKRCGLPPTGNKSDLLRHLAYGTLKERNVIKQSDDIIDDPAQCDTKQLISIDLGLKHLAMVKARTLSDTDSTVEISSWQLLDLELSNLYTPRSDARSLINFVSKHGLMADKETQVVIERQRARTGGSAVISESILRNNLLSASLHGILGENAWSVLPRRVGDYFGLSDNAVDIQSKIKGKMKRSKLKHQQKKAAAIALVDAWLSNDMNVRKPDLKWRFAPELQSRLQSVYHEQKKKDDLCDALLQALAVLDWQQHRVTMRNCFIWQRLLSTELERTKLDSPSKSVKAKPIKVKTLKSIEKKPTVSKKASIQELRKSKNPSKSVEIKRSSKSVKEKPFKGKTLKSIEKKAPESKKPLIQKITKSKKIDLPSKSIEIKLSSKSVGKAKPVKGKLLNSSKVKVPVSKTKLIQKIK